MANSAQNFLAKPVDAVKIRDGRSLGIRIMDTGLASLDEFIGLKSAGLDADILVRNYFAARGLPGTEKSNLPTWFAKQSEWGGKCKFQICRHMYRFDAQANQEPTPYSYGNSLARFFCWHMLQVLQLHCGVKYHPDRKFNPDFCQPPDIFAHGIMDDDGQGGTCASMPVVYVSMGRYLGLPVYLVETRGHAFFRYDDPKGTTIRWTNPDLVLWIPPDRFNIEGAGEGIAFLPDSHYMVKPELWTRFDYEHGDYLGSMTAKEELAGFLIERGECFWDLGNKIEALRAYHYARQLAPNNERYKWLHAKRSREYQQFEAADRAIEEQVRMAYEQQFIPGEHSLHCKCAKCQAPKVQRWQPNAHNPHCQCADCRNAKELAMEPTGMAGHPTTCQCSGCLMQRQAPRIPGQPAFGIANQSHNHTIPGHAIPGLHQPIPGLPGF